MINSFFFVIDLSPQLITGDPYNKYVLAHDCGAVMVKRIPVTTVITDLDENLIWRISASSDKKDSYNITTPKGQSLHGMVTPFTTQEPYILLSLIRDTEKTNWNLNITRDGKHAEINLSDYPGFYVGMNKMVNDLSNTYLATIGSKHVDYYDPKVFNSTNKLLNLIPVAPASNISDIIIITKDKYKDISNSPLPTEPAKSPVKISPLGYFLVILFLILVFISIIFSIYFCYKYPLWCLIGNIMNILGRK